MSAPEILVKLKYAPEDPLLEPVGEFNCPGVTEFPLAEAEPFKEPEI